MGIEPSTFVINYELDEKFARDKFLFLSIVSILVVSILFYSIVSILFLSVISILVDCLQGICDIIIQHVLIS